MYPITADWVILFPRGTDTLESGEGSSFHCFPSMGLHLSSLTLAYSYPSLSFQVYFLTCLKPIQVSPSPSSLPKEPSLGFYLISNHSVSNWSSNPTNPRLWLIILKYRTILLLFVVHPSIALMTSCAHPSSVPNLSDTDLSFSLYFPKVY